MDFIKTGLIGEVVNNMTTDYKLEEYQRFLLNKLENGNQKDTIEYLMRTVNKLYELIIETHSTIVDNELKTHKKGANNMTTQQEQFYLDTIKKWEKMYDGAIEIAKSFKDLCDSKQRDIEELKKIIDNINN